MEQKLLENIYNIICENTDKIEIEDGVNMFYTENNKIFIEINNVGTLFEINIKEIEM